ncbi:hypothetical protein CLV84_1967 [Neolewinella xylanilytica]|uniref:Uncharacterized protein n=1 Tax=Neolewinella xylanilytica TaxID=1514080 RepID=A0A2S6I1M3_9BACT|nr:hypothetical protein [Neolewinella xylanilytica]PPK85076.1 hypothetical protein CLV84_1967 [Neolewinella xylanilytica]
MASENAHLDSTIKSLDQGLEKAKTGATRSINSWVDALGDSEDEDLIQIADELEELGDLLEENDYTPAQLKKALTSLGKKTTAVASQAEGATAEKIKTLGKQLTDAAKSL